MQDSIFVSYRRADSQHAAFAIADRLRWAFGRDAVFFDRGSIDAGQVWPDELRQGLLSARVLVVVLGPAWLTVPGADGQPRINDPEDWVRKELMTGLARRAANPGDLEIIPVALDGARPLSRDDLDSALQDFQPLQHLLLQADHWEEGLENLILKVEATLKRKRVADMDDKSKERYPNGAPARPRKEKARTRAMLDPEVRSELEQLARWQLQWVPHPWGAGGLAQEIAKSFDFDSFGEAVAFMAYAAQELGPPATAHHPRWENMWKVVNVAFSTWDVDCRVTRLDIKAAREFDAIRRRWPGPAAAPAG